MQTAQATQAASVRADLDLQFLDQLVTHLGTDVVAELMADGIIELVDRLDRMAEMSVDEHRAVLAAMAHDVGGQAGNMGLVGLSRLALRAEQVLKDPGLGDGAEAVVAVLDRRDTALDALRSYLTQLDPAAMGDAVAGARS